MTYTVYSTDRVTYDPDPHPHETFDSEREAQAHAQALLDADGVGTHYWVEVTR